MNIKKVFLKYVLFNILSMIGMSCYVLADTLFISNGVGLKGLAALNLTLPVYNLIFGLGALIGVGGATRFSILKTQGKNQDASAYFTHSFIITIIVSIPFIIAGIFFSKDIVKILGANFEIIDIASLYLRTFITFTPFFIFEHVIVTFVRNDQNPRLASLAMLSATLFNIIFDYILIYPCQLGMFGAALATGVSPIIALSICSLHFIKKQNHFHLIKCSIKWSLTKNIIQIGMPSFITELSGGIIIFVFNSVIFHIGGNTAVASYGIISNLAIVVTSLYTGIAQGIQPLISQSYAKYDYQNTQLFLRFAYIMSLIISSVIYICIVTFPDTIVTIFNSENNQMMATIAKEGLLLYFVGFFFVGLNMILTSYFASIEKTKPSFFLSLLRGGIVIIPLVIILAQILGIQGVWLSFPISEFVVLLIAILLKNKEKKSYESKNEDLSMD